MEKKWYEEIDDFLLHFYGLSLENIDLPGMLF